MLYAINSKNQEYNDCGFHEDDYRNKSIQFLKTVLDKPFVVEFEYDPEFDCAVLQNLFKDEDSTVSYFIYEIISVTGETLDSASWTPENFVNIDKLASTNKLVVFTCERNFKILGKPYPIVYCDAYLWWEFQNYANNSFVFRPDTALNKKLLLLNGKDKPSRRLISSYVAGDQNLLNNTVLSYREPVQDRKTKTDYVKIYGDYHTRCKKGLSVLQESTDLLASTEVLYKNVFCRIVTETNFERPYQNFSEKTLDTIRLAKPFVLVAPYRTLSYLKELGFKTFDKYWDESYDTQINPEKRLRKILKVLDYLSSLSYNELNEMYQDMIPILQHNFDQLSKCDHFFENYYRKGKL